MDQWENLIYFNILLVFHHTLSISINLYNLYALLLYYIVCIVYLYTYIYGYVLASYSYIYIYI